MPENEMQLVTSSITLSFNYCAFVKRGVHQHTVTKYIMMGKTTTVATFVSDYRFNECSNTVTQFPSVRNHIYHAHVDASVLYLYGVVSCREGTNERTFAA